MNLERSHPPPPWTSVTSFIKIEMAKLESGVWKLCLKEGPVVFVVVVFPRWIFARKTIYKTDKIRLICWKQQGVQSLICSLPRTQFRKHWNSDPMSSEGSGGPSALLYLKAYVWSEWTRFMTLSELRNPTSRQAEARTVFCSGPKDVKWHWLTINTNRCNIQLHSASMINLCVKDSLFWKMVCLPGLSPRPAPGGRVLSEFPKAVTTHSKDFLWGKKCSDSVPSNTVH